jgi:uncharacterized repeat protein (TIGR02543 family)
MKGATPIRSVTAALLLICVPAVIGCDDSPTAPSRMYTLNAQASPSGTGSITKSPNQSQFTSGASVTLTATSASGYAFTGWQGDASGSTNPITVKMDRNRTVTAVFAPIPRNQYTLTVSASPSDAGTITRTPDQPQYLAGTTVTLTAIPTSRYSFSGWQGDASGSTNPIAITVSGNKTITAAFVEKPSSTSFFNATQDAMSIVSLKVDGEERLRSLQEVRPEKSLEISVPPGPHGYETAHGYFDASGRHDLYTRSGSYTQGLGTQLVKVSGRMIEDLLSPYYWIEECGPESGDKYAFRFYSDRRFEHSKNGTVDFAGAYNFVRTHEFVRVVQFALNDNPNPIDWITLDPLADSFWTWSICSESGVGEYKRSVTPSPQPSNGLTLAGRGILRTPGRRR